MQSSRIWNFPYPVFELYPFFEFVQLQTNHCPKGILIPNYFALYNTRKMMHRKGFSPEVEYYWNYVNQGYGKASACISCRACEKVCPQHIHISEWLPEVAKDLEE